MSGLAPDECGRAFRYIYQDSSVDRCETPRCLPLPSNVPLNVLNVFDFAERQQLDANDYWKQRGADYLTVFEFAHKKGLTQHVSVWPNRIKLDELNEWIVEGAVSGSEFIFCEIGDADPVAHEYGPSSSAYMRIAQEIDSVVQSILLSHEKFFPEYDILIFGDNGMTPVNDYVDICSILKELGGTKTKFDMFIDSVIARVWSKDLGFIERVNEFDWASLPTILLGQELKRSLGMNLDRVVVGDVAIMSTPGAMFFPNYYNVKKELGTHGYGVLSDEEQSYFIHYSPSSSDSHELLPIKMPCFYKHICTLLDGVLKCKC